MEIEIPKRKPKVIQQETLPDQRKFAVLPMRAIADRRLKNLEFRIFVGICSYANRAGITYVSQYRMADDMKVFQPQVSKAVKRLVELGYLEVIGTHVPNKRGQTVRVLFDEKISTQDAIGIASSQTDEDLRPPAQKEKEVKELQDTWTEEEMRENKERLAKMLFKAFKTPADNPDLYTDKPTDSLTVKRIKRDIRDNMRKQRKELITSRLSEHKKNSLYNSEVITKEVIDNTEDMKDNLAVIESQKRLSLDDVIRVFKENLFNEIKSDDVRFVEMLCQIGVTESELIAAIDANKSATPRQIVDAVVNARV